MVLLQAEKLIADQFILVDHLKNPRKVTMTYKVQIRSLEVIQIV